MNVRANASYLIKVSRVRFWPYVLGPLLVGYTAGLTAFPAAPTLDPYLVGMLVLFSFPANLFLYGVNDLNDGDTDRYNQKKGGYEARVSGSAETERLVRLSVWVTAGVLVLSLVLLPNGYAAVYGAVFLLLSWAYSAPPLRCKAKPVLDSLSNVLYVVPAAVGFAVASGGESLPLAVWLTAGSWCAAMHLYSAVPDIASDTEAQLKTSATVLGHRWALIVCAALWLGTAVGSWFFAHSASVTALLLVYPVLCLVLAFRSPEATARAYRWFPVLNFSLGFYLFIVTMVSKVYAL